MKKLETVVNEHIAAVFLECRQNIRKTAAVLGICRSTLYKKLKELGLRAESNEVRFDEEERP